MPLTVKRKLMIVKQKTVFFLDSRIFHVTNICLFYFTDKQYFCCIWGLLWTVFTMWRDVRERDLHEALQHQEGQAGVDDQPHELTGSTLREQQAGKKKESKWTHKIVSLIDLGQVMHMAVTVSQSLLFLHRNEHKPFGFFILRYFFLLSCSRFSQFIIPCLIE